MAEEIVAKKEPLFGMKGVPQKGPATGKKPLRKKVLLAVGILVIIGIAVAVFLLLDGTLEEEALEKASILVPFLVRK